MSFCTPWRDNFRMLCILRHELSNIQGIQTCKIGIESNITAADYPIIRLQLEDTRNAPALARETATVLIYAGCRMPEFEQGIEGQYHWLLDMDRVIRDVVLGAPIPYSVVWKQTVFDDDRLPGFKLLASFYEVE